MFLLRSASSISNPLSLSLFIFRLPTGFTDQPGELRGFPLHTHLIKGSRGFGFNIVGGSRPREFLQVYSVTASGPSALKTGTHTINQRLRESELKCKSVAWDDINRQYAAHYQTYLQTESCEYDFWNLAKKCKLNILISGVFERLSGSPSPIVGILIYHSKCISQTALNPQG